MLSASLNKTFLSLSLANVLQNSFITIIITTIIISSSIISIIIKGQIYRLSGHLFL